MPKARGRYFAYSTPDSLKALLTLGYFGKLVRKGDVIFVRFTSPKGRRIREERYLRVTERRKVVAIPCRGETARMSASEAIRHAR
jgi:hypothetical protein